MVRTRDELALLWLLWCVDAHDPAVALIGDAPAQRASAAQLRITDLDTPAIRAALSSQRSNGDFSWPKIESIAESFRAQAACGGTIIVDGDRSGREQPTLMHYADAKVICEGNHRASALWISEVTDFELRVTVAAFQWPDYANRALRSRGQTFRASDQPGPSA